MGIVFSCLALLYVFFRILGLFMAHKQAIKKAGKIQPIKAAVKTGERLPKPDIRLRLSLKTVCRLEVSTKKFISPSSPWH